MNVQSFPMFRVSHRSHRGPRIVPFHDLQTTFDLNDHSIPVRSVSLLVLDTISSVTKVVIGQGKGAGKLKK